LGKILNCFLLEDLLNQIYSSWNFLHAFFLNSMLSLYLHFKISNRGKINFLIMSILILFYLKLKVMNHASKINCYWIIVNLLNPNF
jgi:hypothetical protein